MMSFRRTDMAVRLMGLVSSRDRPDAPLEPTGTAICLYDLVLSRAEPVPVAERLGLWFPCQEADPDAAHRQALRDQILQQPMPDVSVRGLHNLRVCSLSYSGENKMICLLSKADEETRWAAIGLLKSRCGQCRHSRGANRS